MGRSPAANDWLQGAGRDACMRPRYLERLCAAARALRRRRCAVVRTSGRRCPRGQVGSGVGAGPSGRPGMRTAPLLLGRPGARKAPHQLSASCPRTRKAPFPARPGPRPSRHSSACRPAPLASSYFTILAVTCRLWPLLLSPAFRDCPPQPRDFSLFFPGN